MQSDTGPVLQVSGSVYQELCLDGYLRMDGGMVSYLLWPACIAHSVIALLLVRGIFSGKGGSE
jgi:hypothetical protein